MKFAIVSLCVVAISTVSCREALCGCQPGPQLVCASNDVTYRSLCHMKCGDFNQTRRLVHYGACEVRQPYICGCQPFDEPVCASDGITYPNECEMNCGNFNSGRQVVHEGPCRTGPFY